MKDKHIKTSLVNIFNLLHSIEVKGESVKILAFIEQQLEELIKTEPEGAD